LTVLTAGHDGFIAGLMPLVARAAASTDENRIWTHFANFVSKNRRDHEDDAWRLCIQKCTGSIKVWLKGFEALIGEKSAVEAME
jgi:hypothetical protein